MRMKATERRAERYARKISKREHKLQEKEEKGNLSARKKNRLEQKIARKTVKLEAQRELVEADTVKIVKTAFNGLETRTLEFQFKQKLQ